MTLDLAADSSVFFNDFAESIRFRTDSEADPRTILANVNRMPVEDAGEQPFSGTRNPVIHVMVRNDDEDGITPDEVTEDASQIEVAFKLGDTVRWRFINRVMRQNAGCVLLEIREP